ncbi:hypothetical protein CY34DRAFT_811687 [Suillus luteus UH-Slu-Lm8-n1]|uniref:Uncharacterized protein n=1 Tax=Suillus luteus UH-Slu-Lm8-n1 TaxID=930992 RepID=A0A0D0A2U3_9AGAM|nr:hypothetical protein CY34DRAFT_811687 [Suillus luteus UH-Slu-Lm8-n1]
METDHGHMRDTCNPLRKSVLVLVAYCSLLNLSTNYDQPIKLGHGAAPGNIVNTAIGY